jgi:hypothetical protein
MTEKLLTTTGEVVIVDEGESCNVTAIPEDMAGNAIAKASLLTLAATLYDEATEAIINSRSAQSVLDANGGAVASNGTLTLRLQVEDSPISGTVSTGAIEWHVLMLTWTWNDGVLPRTGKKAVSIGVRSAR